MKYLDEIKELNDIVENALIDVLTEGTLEVEESRRRDGFIPSSYNKGGFRKREFIPLSALEASGCRFNNQKADEKVEEFIEFNRKIARDNLIESHPELKEMDKDEINYNDLYEKNLGKLAEELSNLEMEMASEDTIMREIRAMYYGVDEDGVHSMLIDAVINWESPYHRSGKNNEVLKEETIEFKTAQELETKLKKVLSEMVDFLGGENVV